ncbi:MAG TPA: hypothetical protein VIH24_00275 [Candidatus Limnocylindria bacterium]|jgi:hypothetical protein
MILRRAILTIGLLVLAGSMIRAGLLPESEDQSVILFSTAFLSLAAAVTLFVWRRLGALLALAAGAAVTVVAVGMGFIRGFSGQPVDLSFYIATYVGIGVTVLALIDLVAVLLPRRSAET